MLKMTGRRGSYFLEAQGGGGSWLTGVGVLIGLGESKTASSGDAEGEPVLFAGSSWPLWLVYEEQR